jgi:hypothetical protein
MAMVPPIDKQGNKTMARKNATKSPLNSNQLETLDALIVAQSSFDDCLIACINAGILSAMFDAKHIAFTMVQGRYAARLPAEEMQLFLSSDKASRGSAKAKVMDKLGAAMRRAKNSLADIERVSAATGKDKETVAKEKAAGKVATKAGAKGSVSDFNDLQMKDLQNLYNRTKRNQVSETPAKFDHAAAFTLLHALADLCGHKLKEPATAK